ncbi:unnamed protein product [Allacma fusca]|uniref:Uncharacterized protein n=1 Tax=Allacma fusca TaxID=39272 RepID=A0A8J2P085_9HEXA|nr:unnamed protein product [Allacma fusca]
MCHSYGSLGTPRGQNNYVNKLVPEGRCTFPPECVETTYRACYKTPPAFGAPRYCSAYYKGEVERANQLAACKGVPPFGYPMYCLDGGRPPDARPIFDHLSTYEADFAWNFVPRYRVMGGEIPCCFERKPL